ncbi:MAG: NADH-quinone oxidoreductase subunit C, partial [Pseudomonadota bacterium]|nr:NADH-quinone oxidoreductase subunit C [Pseudomonadota bacterium]
MTDDSGSPPAVEPTRIEVLAEAVSRRVAGLTPLSSRTGELTYEVAAERLLAVATSFRNDAELAFEMCMDVCGVDYLEHGRSEWKTESATLTGFSRGVARA